MRRWIVPLVVLAVLLIAARPGASVAGDLRVVVNLSAAQIRALAANPVEAIPAPGPGKVIWAKRMFVEYTFVSTPYEYSYADPTFAGSNIGITVEQGLTLDVPESRISFQPLATYPETGVSYVNKALLIFANPNGLDPGQDGDGTLRITIDYEIVTL